MDGSRSRSMGESASSASNENSTLIENTKRRSSSSESDSETETSCFETDSDSSEDDVEDRFEKSRNLNPTEVRNAHWVWCKPQHARHISEQTLGKWLLFRPYTLLDEMWHFVRKEVQSGVLSTCTTGAKCSCLYYNPSTGGPGRCTGGVICIYTTAKDVDKAGFILIDLVKHDIKYKTDEATLDGEYTWLSGGKKSVCLKTLYWNKGEPSFEFKARMRGPNNNVRDEWHLNRVYAPKEVMAASSVYGYWKVVHDDNFCLTSFWHFLRKRIESGRFGPVEMVCPPKRDRNDPQEKVKFILYTAYENITLVGTKLAKYTGRNVYYTIKDVTAPHTPVYEHKILWRRDGPEYVMNLKRV